MENKFQFSGKWEVSTVLKSFAQFNNPAYTRTKGSFTIRFDDVNDNNPDPTPEQIQTIEYVINHQDIIIENIYKYVVEFIYPTYKTYQDPEEYPECYPEINQITDLKKLLALSEVIISFTKKDGFAYYVLVFSSCLDHEHGLCISMYKDRTLAFAEIGGMDYRCMTEDGGDTAHAASLQEFGDQPNYKGLFHPHPKYNSLKPWQENFNLYYPQRLIRQESYDVFAELLEEGEPTFTKQLTAILCQAIRASKPRFVDLLLKHKMDRLSYAVIAAMGLNDFDTLQKLKQYGVDLNEFRGPSSPLFKALVKLERNYAKDEIKEQQIKIIEYLFAGGINPYLKEEYGRNALFCYRNFKNEAVKTEIAQFIDEQCVKYGILNY